MVKELPAAPVDPRMSALNAVLVKAAATGASPLSAKDAEFAASLSKQYARRGELSDKQWPWVVKLTERATAPAPAKAPALVTRGAFAAFARVTKEGAAYPRCFIADGGHTLQLKPAPSYGRNAGSLYVYLQSGYSKVRGEYVGCLKVDDTLRLSKLDETTSEVVIDALRGFGHDCVEVLKVTGHRIGCCANCARKLTDPRSVNLGIGPICAEYLGIHDQWLAAVSSEEAAA